MSMTRDEARQQLDQLYNDLLAQDGHVAAVRREALRLLLSPPSCATCQMLRMALVGLVGADSREDLEAMEIAIRSMPAPAADKAASVDAIHALLATTMPVEPRAEQGGE